MIRYISLFFLFILIGCSQSPQNKNQENLKEIKESLKQRKIINLEKSLFPLLKKDPKNPELLWLTGEFFYLRLNHAQALKFFRRAVKEKSDLLKGWIRLEKLYQERGGFPYLDTLNKLIQLDPSNWQWHYLLARYNYTHHHYDKALKLLAHATTLKKNHPPVLIWKLKTIIALYGHIDQKNWRDIPLSNKEKDEERTKLKRQFSTILATLQQQNPKDPLPGQLNFDFLVSSEQCDQAPLNLPDHQYSTLITVASCYHLKNREDLAIKWLQKSFNLFPDHPEILSKIAALIEKRNPAKSIAYHQLAYQFTGDIHPLFNSIRVMIAAKYPREEIHTNLEKIKQIAAGKEQIIIKSLEKKVKNME